MVSQKDLKEILSKSFFWIILVLAIFLRFFRLEENFIFSGELGHNFLAIKSAFINRQIPLVGPPTSHPWLSFGPLFYWLFGPLLVLSSFNPLSAAYFGALIGILTIILNFLVTKKIFGEKVALFSSLLITISPLWNNFFRDARFFSLVLPLVYLFLWSVDKRKFFVVGLSLGVMLNFHYTALIFVPVVLSLMAIGNSKSLVRMTPFLQLQEILKRVQGDVVRFLTGILIPSLPLLLYDATNHSATMSNLLVWIPYRVAGFVGFYPKNTISLKVVQETLLSFYRFFSESFLPEGNSLAPLLLIVLAIFVVKKIRKPLILFWFAWGMLALFVHGQPPIHYFLPLFPLPMIIFSLFLFDLWTKKLGQFIVIGLLLTMVLVNFNFFFSDRWFFLPQEKIWPKTFYVPFKIQKEIVKTIVNDAAGRPYNLARVGPFDYFEEDFAQNYRYLAWWLGNEPVSEKVKLRYTIYEDQTKIPQSPEKLIKLAEITVVKEKE